MQQILNLVMQHLHKSLNDPVTLVPSHLIYRFCDIDGANLINQSTYYSTGTTSKQLLPNSR